MKSFLVLFLLFMSITLFAIGEKSINVNFADVTIKNGELKDNQIVMSEAGEITFYVNLLRDRVYTINIEGQENVKAKILSLYKYAKVNECNIVVNKTGSFVSHYRQDNTRVVLSVAPGVISKINFEVVPEAPLYGLFIMPQYKNIVTKSTGDLIFRYFSNHEELGKEDGDVNMTFSIKDKDGNIKWSKTEKGASAKGFYSIKNPKLSEGNYVFTCETKSGDAVLGTFSCDLIYGNVSDDLYPDENGRLWWKGKMFVMLGLMGNYDKSQNIGINTYVENNTLNIMGEDSHIPVFLPTGYVTLDTFKDTRKRLSICDNVETSPFAIMGSDYFGLRLQNNVFENIKEMFEDYGFYFPLINVIDVNENLHVNFWETFAQTQTGLIFNLNEPVDIEKIKPYVEFVKKYETVILSNAPTKTYAFGNIKCLIRNVGNEEYVFLMETRGKECEVDILTPKNKNKVYEGDTLLKNNNKQKNKWTLNLKPYEIKVIRVEL